MLEVDSGSSEGGEAMDIPVKIEGVNSLTKTNSEREPKSEGWEPVTTEGQVSSRKAEEDWTDSPRHSPKEEDTDN